MSLRPLLVLLLANLALAFAPQDADPTLEQFKKYFRKHKDTPTRVEAILSLEGVENPEVVDLLLPMLEDPEPLLARAAVRVLSGFETQPPFDRVFLALTQETKEARRVGLLQVVGAPRAKPLEGFTAAVVPCLSDGSWIVRRQAAVVLGGAGDPSAAAALAPLCMDREVAVVCAALEALAQLGSELVVQPAIAGLSNDSWQVRASAITALARVRHKDGVAALVRRLQVEDGRLRADIVATLENLTARFDIGLEPEKWQAWWEEAEPGFKVLTEQEVTFLRQRQAEIMNPRTGTSEAPAKAEPPNEEVTYHSIETPSRAVIFVIDVSGSMEQEVVDRERYKGAEYPSLKRMDICKTELVKTLMKLESYVKFNVIAFATEVDYWKKDLVQANEGNKSAAAAWVGRLEAIGGASKEDLARAGLVGTANLEAGKTNTFGALTAALGMTVGRPTTKDRYQVEADTIFFLSDGRPSHGVFVDPDDILREVRAANELRKIVIHAIAIGEFEKDFMLLLAQQNGGMFVDLGR